jgi:hypothetical protein
LLLSVSSPLLITAKPYVAEKVAAGELPALRIAFGRTTCRNPLESVGVYGVRFVGITGPNDHNSYVRWMYDSLVDFHRTEHLRILID